MTTETTTPERAGREGDQPLPERGAESVFAEVHRRIDEHAAAAHARVDGREAIGIKRYRFSLQTFNGRDAGRDLEEELLDALAYATQARLERQELDRRLADALEQLRRVDALRLAAEADLTSHVEAQDRRIADLKAQLAAARANWEAERAALEAETSARIQVEQQLRGSAR
jgi:hypothetical protein